VVRDEPAEAGQNAAKMMLYYANKPKEVLQFGSLLHQSSHLVSRALSKRISILTLTGADPTSSRSSRRVPTLYPGFHCHDCQASLLPEPSVSMDLRRWLSFSFNTVIRLS
jgi:hypothetical protein